MRTSMMARIGHPSALDVAKKALDPTVGTADHVWSRILSRIEAPAVSSVFDRLKGLLDPSDADLAHNLLRARLAPVEARAPYGRMKWVAAFALVLVAIRATPAVFLAPKTIAESRVLLVPTTGDVEVSLHGLWQPVKTETALNEQVQLRTADGEATILLHDDGTIRLADRTTVTLHDLTDRPEPALDGATFTLSEGNLWLQGFVPRSVRPVSVATVFGTVSMYDGSAALAIEDGYLTIRVFDRSVTVQQGDTETVLVAGEKARFSTNGVAGTTARISDAEYDDAWVKTNLQRDAVHRREVAQMQRERSAARAGILPTSPLYTVKRVAEQVDVLFTIDPAAKIQKQIDLASTRLNEAAALIAAGGSGAAAPLQEYKDTLLTLASGSGGDSVMQFLLRQEVAENAAALSATDPTDELYELKKVVLQASADLPDLANSADIEGMILVDALDALHEAIAAGDTAKATAIYASVESSLPLLQSGSLAIDVQKEAQALLTQAADQIQAGTGADAEELAADLKPFLPVIAPELPSIRHLTDEEVVDAANQILSRVYKFNQPRPRLNQLVYEINQMSNHPDAARILRSLYRIVPAGDALSRAVRQGIQEYRE